MGQKVSKKELEEWERRCVNGKWVCLSVRERECVCVCERRMGLSQC